MYRLKEELFRLLEKRVDRIRIGYMCPYGALNTDAEFVLEEDYLINKTFEKDISWEHISAVEGFWLWRRCDLSHEGLPMTFTLPDGTKKDEILEGVLVASPSKAHRLHEAVLVSSLSELLEMEPGLSKYVSED